MRNGEIEDILRNLDFDIALCFMFAIGHLFAGLLGIFLLLK